MFKGPSAVQLNERLEALIQEKEIIDEIRKKLKLKIQN